RAGLQQRQCVSTVPYTCIATAPRTTSPPAPASKKQTGRQGRPVLSSLGRFLVSLSLLAFRVDHKLDLCTLRIDDRHTVLRGEVLVAADLRDLLHNGVWEGF